MSDNTSSRAATRLKTVPVDGGFIVRRQSGRLHGDFDSAASEAERLSALYPSPHFIVLKVVGVQQAVGDETGRLAGTKIVRSASHG